MIRHMYAGPGIDAAKMRADALRISTTNDRFNKPTTVILHMHRYEMCPAECSLTQEKFPAAELEPPKAESEIREPMHETCEHCGRTKPVRTRCSCPEGSRPVIIDADGTVHHA